MLQQIIATYGEDAKAKLTSPAVTGAPEDQIRAPIEALVKGLAGFLGLPEKQVVLVGETMLAGLGTRPDYAVTVKGALVGFIELKAPGKGADPRKFTDPHDRRQWTRLKLLPNLLYTDGESFSLWQNGERAGQTVRLIGDLDSAGATLTAPVELVDRIKDFLSWSPIPPSTPRQLAEVAARLCRLLREEVLEELDHGAQTFLGLRDEWRTLLFPNASSAEFADGYAQAVTFGLLMARAQSVSLDDKVDHAVLGLGTNTLIGSALRLLTDDQQIQKALGPALRSLLRVLGAVDWSKLSKGRPEAWLYFYEDFLEVYDNDLRKQTGSYYTPPEVVEAMVRLTDEALRHPALFDRPQGLASKDVTIADPATGTGTFLLSLLRRIAATVAADKGEGAVPGALAGVAQRLIGFELQFGPFAVAQLRLLAEVRALMGQTFGGGANLPVPRLFVTDTLGDPYAAQTQFSALVAPIGKSREEANAIKRDTPITVVIGNPPYKEKAKGRGGWIEAGSVGRAAPMDLWTPPPDWGVGAHLKHLKNLYVYFWRWATWKVFAPDLSETTGRPDEDRGGIVCFITVSGFLNGPGFAKMRAELRRDCSDIWVVDCSPEGHQPEVPSRIFQGVQHPVCIVLAARTPGKDRAIPARLRVRTLPEGKRQVKFEALAQIDLDGPGWSDGPSDWRASFLAESTGAWPTFPALDSLFVYDGSGVMPGRTWVIAPDEESLRARWKRLVQEKDAAKKEALFYPHLRNGQPGDKHAGKDVKAPLPGYKTSLKPVALETDPLLHHKARYAFRSFDRQWIIPDARVINQPNPELWGGWSTKQVYLTALSRTSPTDGPAVTVCCHIPDLDHFKGNFGGRVFPLWRDAAATVPNLKPALLAHLADVYGHPVAPEDLMAYIAALLAHPAFSARFAEDLRRPGLRVPMTADPALFTKAVGIGREVIWLHTYGERFADTAQGRPKGAPRMAPGTGLSIPAAGTIPAAPEPLPEEMRYDTATRRLHIGKGFVANVPPEVADYEVSGRNVVERWFSYRRRDRTRPVIGDRRPPSPLDAIQPDHWLSDYTDDLMDLLHVLGRLVLLEPAQKDLLDVICAGPLVSAADLDQASALAATATATGGKGQAQEAVIADLFD